MTTTQVSQQAPVVDPALDALAHRWFDAMSTGDLDVVDEMFAPDYHLHLPDVPEDARGPEVIRGLVTAYRVAFPDLRFVVEEVMTSGEKVLVRWTASGTNSGPLLGVPASGRSARWTGMSLLRIRDGRVQEDWVEMDRLGLMQQIGVVA